VGLPALVLLGAAIGNSRALAIKRTWVSSSLMYAAFVGLPGDRKSPALDHASQPLHELQARLTTEHEDAYRQYKDDQATYEVQAAAWQRAIKDGNARPSEKPREPAPPTLRRVVVQDITFESLADLLAVNGRGMAMVRDELSGFVRSMDQYRAGKGSDRQHYLSIWNSSRLFVDRKHKPEPTIVPRPFLSIVGAIQPDILSEMSDEQGREDGFIHRFLFSYPDSVPTDWTEDELSERVRQGYADVLDLLWRLEPEEHNGRELPRVVRFTAAGREEWVRFDRAHHREMNDPLSDDSLRGPWAKLEAYCGRIALTLHMARYVTGEAESEAVDEISVLSAWELIDYFKAHARRVYARLYSSKDDVRLADALSWLGKQERRAASVRDFCRANVAGCKTREQAESIFGQLANRGYGTVEKVKVTGGERLCFRLTALEGAR
jgi:hypothetical protein